MKKYINLSVLLSAWITLNCCPEILKAMNDENEKEYVDQVRKLRKVVVETPDAKVPEDETEQESEEGKEIVAYAIYMMAPEDDQSQKFIDRGIVGLCGQEEDDFWAAELVGKYSTFGKMLKSTCSTTRAVIRTTDSLEERKSIFYGKDRKRTRPFSHWPRVYWKIKENEAEAIKSRVMEQRTQPLFYNVFGLNFNVFNQNRVVVNGGMWAQSILKTYYSENENLARLALIGAVNNDKFTCWLNGLDNKGIRLLAECAFFVPLTAFDIVRAVWLIRRAGARDAAIAADAGDRIIQEAAERNNYRENLMLNGPGVFGDLYERGRTAFKVIPGVASTVYHSYQRWQ